ncbi:hypothetical protein PSCICO_17350 [Pseudomonas cichorii]|nr:hypothetical protein PSCICO_17350 [Pseudomonas cichorii]
MRASGENVSFVRELDFNIGQTRLKAVSRVVRALRQLITDHVCAGRGL